MRPIIKKVIKNKATFYLFSHQEQKKKIFKIVEAQKQKQPIIYPKQYPNHPLTDASPIISRERPIRRLTPKYEVPQQKMMPPQELIRANIYGGKWKSPINSYTLNVGLIGPVNAGKSELFGTLAHHVSAVSPKASTTTEIIAGIKSYQQQNQEGIRNIQIKYYDTPGLMYKKQGFLSKGWKVLSQIDFALLVVDSAKRFDDMVRESIKRLQSHREYPNFMKSLVLNKIDLVDNRRKFDSLIRQIEKFGKFDKIFYVSAKTGYGIEQLQKYLLKMAKPRQWEYPAQVKTDLTQMQIYEEMLREAVYNRSYKEVPHQIIISCSSHSQLSSGKDQILFNLYVETQNQQRMIIGTQGRNLKEMIDRFKVSYAKMFNKQVRPLVSVKIMNKFMKKLGGREETIFSNQKQQNQQKLKILNEAIDNKRSTGIVKSLIDGEVQKVNQNLKHS